MVALARALRQGWDRVERGIDDPRHIPMNAKRRAFIRGQAGIKQGRAHLTHMA